MAQADHVVVPSQCSEEVGQSCESIKWTGVVDHVLAKWPPHVGLQSSVIAIQIAVFLCSKSDAQNTVCICGLLDVPLHDVARLLAVDAIDVVKSQDVSDANKYSPYRLPVRSFDVASAVKACMSIGPMYQEQCTSMM